MTNHMLSIQPTPNPNAFKFILDRPVKQEGKSTYRSPMDADANPLALALFTIRGIDQIHFFQNTITITKFGYEEWDNIEPQVMDCIESRIDDHDSSYMDPNPEEERRKNLSPEILEIETILDKTIRPGLQGDGGDLQCISFEDNVLIIRYQGACGTCPSSSTGTLEAIRGILRDEYNEGIEVYIEPTM
jgi:Fe-S cluster biogenesis protein NfuA